MLGKGIGAGVWSGLRPATIQPPVDIVAERGYAQYPIVPVLRAGIATRRTEAGLIVTEAANAHRYDWTTGARALLLEGDTTNICIHSEDFTNWGGENQTPTKFAAIAPSGEMTANRLTENTANGQHRTIRTGLSITSGKTYVATVYAKSANRSVRMVLFSGGAEWNAAAVFNLQTGVVSGIAGATVITAKMDLLFDGWYRIELRSTAVGSTANAQMICNLVEGANAIYTGDGVSGAYIWGAQIEEGLRASSYIKTTAATAARVFDRAEVIDISSADLADGYTLFADFDSFEASGGFDRVAQLDNGSDANRHMIRYSSGAGTLDAVIDDSSVTQALYPRSLDVSQRVKCAFTVGPNFFCGAFNGASSTEDLAVNYTAPTILRIGQAFVGNGRPRRIRVRAVTIHAGIRTRADLEAMTAIAA